MAGALTENFTFSGDEPKQEHPASIEQYCFGSWGKVQGGLLLGQLLGHQVRYLNSKPHSHVLSSYSLPQMLDFSNESLKWLIDSDFQGVVPVASQCLAL